jgi:uncharacterized protein (DUF2344 family)
MRMFQRACVRAGVQIAYSQGFNPHQRMSLVPPRSVGVESDDDLLCLWLKEGQTAPVRKNSNTELSNESQISNGAGIDVESLKNVLPQGIEIISAETSEAKNIPEPISARYVMKVQEQKIDDEAKKRIADMLANDKFIVNRKAGEDSRTKPVDVRPFLETIKAEPEGFVVDCKISPAGTIRVDEILGLLQLKTSDLIGPVRRTSLQWKGI